MPKDGVVEGDKDGDSVGAGAKFSIVKKPSSVPGGEKLNILIPLEAPF